MTSPSPIPSYIFGSLLSIFGLIPLISPKKDYELFGLPLESSSPIPNSSDKQTAVALGDGVVSPYVYAKGVRDLTYGLTYLLLQAQGQDTAITTFTGVVCITAFADGLIVWLYGGKKLQGKAWGHFGTMVALAAWAGRRASQ